MRRISLVLAAALAAGLVPGSAVADDLPVGVPVLSSEVPRGSVQLSAAEPVEPTAKAIDGEIADWTGDNPGYAGFAVHSAGELIYQDYLFDAYGADDGGDYDRPLHDDAQSVVGETYRLEGLQRKDVPGEFGAPNPAPLQADTNHGNLTEWYEADLHELRFAAGDRSLDVLARTTTLTSATETGVLLLIDSTDASERVDVPFDSGIVTDVADHAVLLNGDQGTVVDLRAGSSQPLPAGSVATNPDGWTNAIEASIPLAAIGDADKIEVMAATGGIDPATGGFEDSPLRTPLANVAFRPDEPVRWWFDRLQAYALYEQNIDRFAETVDLDALRAGATENLTPTGGYHERVFRSSEAVSTEGRLDGIYQHYGVYVPSAYDGTAAPLQWWLHWRGGTAHEGAGVAPRIFKHFGEDRDTIVISPRGRGTGTWYVGEGHVDILEVFDDVRRALNVDPNRVYVSGHSMGGWGSYLLSILHPDWFAAAAPFAGPVTQGAWTGLDFEGCDELEFDGNTPCYIAANGSNPRVQHTRRLLENVLHIPFAVFQGGADELVPVSGVTRQVERFVQLGYRHRYYLSPTYEHYTHPAMDEWTEAARYEHSFVRDPNPARVVYFRDMPFERATETVQANGAILDFTFDTAYWMSELTPVDTENGVARFDGTSRALTSDPYVAAPDTGPPTAPGQVGPYVVAGTQWLDDPTQTAPTLSNGFDFSLAGASRVRLDLARMDIDTSEPIAGTVSSDGVFTLRLEGAWASPPTVTAGSTTLHPTLAGGVLEFQVPAGTSLLTIG